MPFNYIIVQAGGRGSRMEKLTRNKPKALVPVDNLPMIFHLFRKFADKHFIIIGDYHYDVLDKYLKAFATVDYKMVCASGKSGTCAGLSDALSLIPDHERFMLIWCDLVLPDDYQIPETENNVIGISRDFPCRWKYENGHFEEERSSENGVAGHFIFNDKSWLTDVPDEGELVRWIQQKGYVFEEQPLYRTHEYGLYSEWNKLPVSRCRPFNSMRIEDDRIYKVPIDDQGQELATREVMWYQRVMEKGCANIPIIYTFTPLCMERIDGKNIYEYADLTIERKRQILQQLILCLKQIHAMGEIPADEASYRVAYLTKTFDRLEKVRRLVPFADQETVTVNGRKCRNVFAWTERLEELVMAYMPSKFVFIHGDCTFSNMMLRKDGTPVLIDPRGYFGKTEIFGDAAYDWVKLYYSLFSNYDQFNLKRFDLTIGKEDVRLEIASNGWELLENDFFAMLSDQVTRKQMKLLLAIIWLSLTTYAWEDYDSICGAFYQGLYYLEEVL